MKRIEKIVIGKIERKKRIGGDRRIEEEKDRVGGKKDREKER